MLFGTGIGSAFHLLVATARSDARLVAQVARQVVIADWLFTAPAAVLQPLTGFYLVHLAGLPLGSKWILWSIVLYGIAIACWLPVIVLQMRMRDLAAAAGQAAGPLPAAYWRYFRLWCGLGVPAFLALVSVFYLMVWKPQ